MNKTYTTRPISTVSEVNVNGRWVVKDAIHLYGGHYWSPSLFMNGWGKYIVPIAIVVILYLTRNWNLVDLSK